MSKPGKVGIIANPAAGEIKDLIFAWLQASGKNWNIARYQVGLFSFDQVGHVNFQG
jgi:hypothetical protein